MVSQKTMPKNANKSEVNLWEKSERFPSNAAQSLAKNDFLRILPWALFRRGGNNGSSRYPRRCHAKYHDAHNQLLLCNYLARLLCSTTVAQSGVVYETNFHKIALYPPWAAATVPPAKCPARATTPIHKIQRVMVSGIKWWRSGWCRIEGGCGYNVVARLSALGMCGKFQVGLRPPHIGWGSAIRRRLEAVPGGRVVHQK